MSRRRPSLLPALAGISLLCIGLTGCSNSGSFSGTTPTTTTSTTGSLAAGGATNVYALNDVSTNATTGAISGVNNLLEFPTTSSGTSTVPTTTLPLSTLEPAGAALDGSGLLYVAGTDDVSGISSVSVYAAGAASGSAPLRTFQTNAAYYPDSIAVTSAGQAYVIEDQFDANGDVIATQIEVFAAGTTSGTAATAVITGAATQMIDPADIAVDSAGNIYVANYQDDNVSQILEFAAGSTGNAAPLQTITFNGEITGIAVDTSANIYAAEVNSAGNASIVEYTAGSLSQTPAKTISGTVAGLNSADTGVVRVDAAGNIWLLQQTASANAFSSAGPVYFTAWPPTASGNVAPSVAFAPPSLVNPNGAFAIH